MKKLNWQQDFLELVKARANNPFEWGKVDCVLFAAEAITTMGHDDPAAASRGKYKTEAGAKRHLVSKYKDLYAAWDAVLERLENINYVQNGDVVLFEGALGLTNGIYWNGGIFAPSLDGVRYLDEHHSKILAAWRV